MKAKLTLLILLGALKFYAVTQNCELVVRGTLVDKHDGETLPFALVQLGKQKTLSTEIGTFRFDNVCNGKDTLKIFYTGNLHHTQVLHITSDTNLHIYPELHVKELETADISIDRHEQAITHQKITEEAIRKHAGSTLSKTLEEVSGVSTLKTGNTTGKPVVHGMHSNRLLLVNNGIRHEGQQWGSEHAPEIDPAIAGEITVVKGASSVRYGSDAIAGAVLIDPAPLRQKKGVESHYTSSFSTNGRVFTNSLVVDGHHKLGIPLGWRLQGTLKSGGNTKTPDYFLDNTGVRERNFSAAINSHGNRVGFDLFYSQFNSEIGILSASHIGNLTDLENIIENGISDKSAKFNRAIKAPYQGIEHELTKVKTYWFVNDSNKIQLTYARQFNRRREFDNHGGTASPELEFEITTHTIDLKYHYFSDHDFKTIVGLNGIRQLNDFDGRFFVPNYISNAGGVYALQSRKIGKWHLEYGVRYDAKAMKIIRFEDTKINTTGLSFASTSLHLGGTYDLNDYTHISLNSARAWRPPSVNELYADGLHHGAAAIEKGDETIEAEKAWNISSEIHYQKQKLDFELDLFYYYFDNYIYAAPTLDYVLTIRGAFPEYQYLQNKAHLYGFDLFGIYKLHERLSVKNKTSFVFGDNLDSNTALVLLPAPQTSLSINYNLNDWKVFSKSEIGVSLFLQPKQWRLAPSQDIAPPPEAYGLLNMNFTTSIKSIKISIEIENLLNTRYRDYLNRWRYYADDLGRTIHFRLNIPIN